MVLRSLLERLLNNPQVIEKLSESYPIRQAAKAAASVIVQGQAAAEDVFKKTQQELAKAKQQLDDIEAKQKKDLGEASSQEKDKKPEAKS